MDGISAPKRLFIRIFLGLRLATAPFISIMSEYSGLRQRSKSMNTRSLPRFVIDH